MQSGKLVVISAPSGTGKTTLLKKVMQKVENLVFSVSHTTRPPRPQEQDGVDYHFVKREQFKEMIKEDQFIEYAEVHGNLYGTSKEAVFAILQDGRDVALDIDVQGAQILRTSAQYDAAYVFISPPTLKDLETRLRKRGTESQNTITLRLDNARKEIECAGDYDYLVINDHLETAVDVFCAIILAERARFQRYPDGRPIGKIM